MVPNVALCFTEHYTLLQNATNIILPLGLVWLLMSLTRRVGVAVWSLFILIFLAAFQIVLLDLYGRSVIAVDMFLNVVTTNASEVGELLSGLLPVIALVVAIYLPPLIMASVAIVRGELISSSMQANCRRLSHLTLVMGIILLGLSMVSSTPYRPLRQLYPLNAVYNLALAMERSHFQTGYPASATGFSFHSEAVDPEPSVTMIVIGETSRASSWQLLGYHRPTTPLLSGRDDIVAFPLTLSQSNTTHKSVPLMLSHLDARSFGDSIFNVKSIISAFKETGARTAFISNQERNGAMIDCFGEEADLCVFLADSLPHSRTDLDLLPIVEKVIEADPGDRNMLIVVHTYGSHYEYDDRYPESMARFTPAGPLEADPDCREMLINAYDNSITLTDKVLDSLITILEKHNSKASLIYTSDHGEDIYDDSRSLFLHASPIPTYEQLHVPLIMWMSHSFRAAYPQRYLAAVANSHRPVASSASIFPTAMQLSGLHSPCVDPTLSLVSNSYTPVDYMYLDDHNEAVSPSMAGFDRYDIARIDSLYTSQMLPGVIQPIVSRRK